MQTFLSILLAFLTILAVSLQRTYSKVPLKELKHRARKGDEMAAAIIKAAGYGHSLRAILWLLIGLSGAGFFVLISLWTPVWLALLLSVGLIWTSFVWVPAGRVTVVGERIAATLAPVLAKLLLYIHPVIDWFVRMLRRHRPITIHSGLYDRADLINLLEHQQIQPDNRIERAEIDIALHALRFGDDAVGQHMVPRRQVRAVSADDPLGPVLMDELHASGHSRFPVYEDKKDNIVGILFLRDLVNAKHGGLIASRMKKHVSYVHEDQSLQDALQAILKTHQQMYVVVNSFEEYVGIITIEDILETILGNPIIDEFDQYDDLRAVAARAAKREHLEHTKSATEEITEVVE